MSSPSVGAHLRRLREGRGVSLEEIARATRVSSGYLHALETDDFASLPVPVFTRGFIRAYCQTLGEAAEPALALYDARSDPTPAIAEAPMPARAGSPRMAAAPQSTPKNRGPLVISFILLVVLGIALLAVTLVLQSGRDPAGAGRTAATPPGPPSRPGASTGPTPPPVAMPDRSSSPPSPSAPSTVTPGGSAALGSGSSSGATSGPAVAATTPAPRSEPSSAPANAPASGGTTAAPAPPGNASAPAPKSSSAAGRHRLVARTTQATWIRVRTEDGRVSEETIPAGQVREWHSTGPFRVTVGNAGGVALEVDGRAVPSLGTSGAVIPHLVLPTEGQ